ncbi:MAG TPA: hypothetical protein VEZ11_08195 [Thermoanaerobaculia bacterium]|nr:hypothetical protein [Thermoanaerobaculia bacterium]
MATRDHRRTKASNKHAPEQSSPSRHRFWLGEIWERVRDHFITIASHAILYLFVAGFYLVGTWILLGTPLLSERLKKAVEAWDGYVFVVLCCTLGILLVIEIVLIAAIDVKKRLKAIKDA